MNQTFRMKLFQKGTLMRYENKTVLVLYKVSGRKIAEILSNFPKQMSIYSVIQPKSFFLSQLVRNYKDLDSKVSNVFFMPTEDYQISLLYPFFLGCKNINKIWLNSHSDHFESIMSKLKFKKFATDFGFNVAEVCKSITAVDKNKTYVLKLDSGSGSNGIKFFNGEELTDTHFSSDIAFLEEYINFEQVIGLSGYAFNGSVDTFLSHRRIIMKDSFGGASRVCKKINSPSAEIEEIASKALEKINFTGPFMFEIGIYDEKLFLIEFNPRLWGSFALFLNHFAKFFNIDKRFKEKEYLVVWSDFKMKTFLWLLTNLDKFKTMSLSPKLTLSACITLILCVLS